MRGIKIIAMIIIATIAMAFELQPVDIARDYELTPPAGVAVETPDSNIIEARLPRNVIVFDFPDGYFDEDNLIMEAVLKISIEPTEIVGYEAAEHRPIEAICVPLTRAVVSPTWASLNSAYDIEYAEVGIYDEEEGILFFEIARFLYDVVEGDLDFYGVMIIPSKGSPPFEIADVDAPIDFRTANFIGARATEE